MNKNAVFEQLKTDEGVVYEIYLDHLGYPTFGIGHLILESDPEHGQPVGTKVPNYRVIEAFSADLCNAIDDCIVLYGDTEWENFPEEVKQILVNMMFNMGRTRLSKFRKMNAWLMERNWKAAAYEGRDSLWYKQVTNRAERLMSRLENV